MKHVVIVGAGLTAASAVEELRTRGHEGPITLIGAEEHLPYERPPLSKGVLLGNDEPDSAYVHDRDWYTERSVNLRLGSPVTAIDTAAKTVTVEGATIEYDALLLATGSRPRHLKMFDESGLDVAYLRTFEDSLSLKAKLTGEILIIGAGWIGLEIASAARQAGASVTVVENAELPLLRALGPEMAKVFAELHREHGVDLRLSTSIESVADDVVKLSDGGGIKPDLVVVGIGVEPATELAEAAGIATDNGVLVDATLRTSDPDVFAAGDIANQDHPVLGRTRVEHWDNAIEQGKHAARAILGDETPYTHLPYFFTDQYDLGMEYVGRVGPEGYDDVVIRGDEKERVLVAYWLKDGKVVAGMHTNDWDAIDEIRSKVRR